MAWVSDENKGTSDLKPVWEYRDGANFVTILPDTTRNFALITGDLDPTGTWISPIEVWVHQFQVQNGFATIICDKWNEACPFCYENEKFKLINPKYKDQKLKLPYPISSKAMLQVYDFQEKRVLWLLAGRKIIEGMEFILSRQAAMFKGYVSITRIGSKLNTNYRVDVANIAMSPEEKAIVAKTVVPFQSWKSVMKLSHKDIFAKTGIHPVDYFHKNISSNIDISKWGKLPEVDADIPFSEMSKPHTENSNSVSMVQSPVTTPSASAVPVSDNSAVDIGLIASALSVKCTMGIYQGKTMGEIVVQMGKSYAQYVSQSGNTEEEKSAAKIILANWDVAIKYQTQGEF